MRLDDDPSDGPELVLRESPAPIERGAAVGSGMLTRRAHAGPPGRRRRRSASTAAAGGTGAPSTDATQAAGRRRPRRRTEGFGPVPPLDASDDFVRALIRQLSQKPEWAAWLASGDLVRSFVVSVDKIAVGSSPGKELKPAAPQGKFQTLGSGRTLRIDPASYDRYNALANVVDAIDPEGAARAYRRLRPLMQQAFDELGYVNLSFDDRLARALGRLVDVPVQEGDVMLKATSVTFQYADPELEELSPAQKHMLRMGPHNMRLVQTQAARLRARGRPHAGGGNVVGV